MRQQKLENLQPEYWSEQLNERRVAQEEEEVERTKNKLKQKQEEVFFWFIYLFNKT
jgi:hypothetical protein